ncbi:MAG: ATP-dependent 6-phosphofructokinase [Myxococcota bacterium]
MVKRIGVLTGGGDCPGLNAVIRAIVKHAHGTYGWQVVGVEDGFDGLYHQRYQDLGPERVRGLLQRGGTILGSSNRADPFHFPVRAPDGSEEIRDVSAQVLSHIKALDLAALITVGGDGTMTIAHQLFQRGVPIIGVPKTIDNDLAATDVTFGFQTAVEIATESLDRLHTTAESHDRIMVCEVMGRYAGWIAMVAGLAGGADVILIPEIAYDIERVVNCFKARHARNITYSLVVVAEGARPAGGEYAVVKKSDGSQLDRLGGAGHRLAQEIATLCDYDVRVTVLGHVQRGGTPTAFDRVLGTRFGVAAVDLAAKGQFGQIVCLRGTRIESASLQQTIHKQKHVDPQGELVFTARSLGVELGG